MYHAMFPHMVVQVGHQGHYHSHLVDSNQRPTRGPGGPNGSVTAGAYENGANTPIEFLQLFRFDGARSNMTYGGRCLNGVNSNGPNIGSNGNSHTNNNVVNASWRDRNAGPMNHVMGPPPSHLGPRPVTNCSMKKHYWGKTNNRSGSGSRDSGSNVPFKEAYSSDSGFSSRSPTPSSQQVSPGSSKSNVSIDEDAVSAAGEPAPSRSSGNENKSSKRHDPSCHPTYYQPFFQHSNHYIGQLSIHQNCAPNFHQNPQHHGSHGFHHHHSPQYTCHQVQRRSESLTSLSQQSSSSNSNQGKRRFHSGRYSPPPSYRNNSRGRRVQTGTVMRSPPLAHSMTGFSAPDRFLQRSHLMYITEKPSELFVGDEWDEVSRAMWDKFSLHQQTEEMYRNKMELWKRLYYPFKRLFPRCGLFLVGSTISGFGSNKSDMDMCLLVRHSEMDQRIEAVGHLDRALKCLRQCSFIVDADLIQAKVPILKFKDADYDLEVDLNCNNAVGIRNTHMLFCYSQMDWRVRPLVLVIKLWAAFQGINDAKNMTISSYSLVLMAINFLQCGVSPPVLPCLHKLYPGKFQPHTDPYIIDLHEELPPVKSENTQSLGSLLLAFLEYYSHFDYTQDAVSVRTASRLPIEECRHARSYKNDPHQWKYLCIEEPFDLTNTAHSVYDHEAFEKIKATFSRSYQALKETRSFDSIFEMLENE